MVLISMVALRTKYKYLETYYRYTTESVCTMVITLGSYYLPFISTSLLCFYVADLAACRFLHKQFYTKQNHYHHHANTATLYRAVRNAAQFAIAYYGMMAFMRAAEITFLSGGALSAAVIIGVLKAAVEIVYSAAEDREQYKVRACKDTCGNRGIFGFL